MSFWLLCHAAKLWFSPYIFFARSEIRDVTFHLSHDSILEAKAMNRKWIKEEVDMTPNHQNKAKRMRLPDVCQLFQATNKICDFHEPPAVASQKFT